MSAVIGKTRDGVEVLAPKVGSKKFTAAQAKSAVERSRSAAMTEKIEYRVRSKTTHFVTRFASEDDGSQSSESIGEYDNEDKAYSVATALAFKEREDLGWPPGDERIIFAQKGV